jgi:TP901 family phage tail tape measure protein|nr:MAG TPA: minor tail protein [Caudoviricetes sp.]
MGIQNKDGALYFASGIDNTGLYRGRREAMGIIKAMAGEVTSFDVFGGLGLSASVAFARAAKGSYDFQKEFQRNMMEVATISDTVTNNMAGYMNRILDLTKRIPIDANNAAKALYQIVSAGHDGEAGMKILEASAKGAIGGITDTATAADAITTLINAYKKSADDAENISDMLFTTVRLGKTTFGELGQSIAQAAPIAAAYGVEMDQVLAAVATLTKQGTPTAQAMTQIRAAIVGVSKYLGDGAYNGRTFQEALEMVRQQAGGSESKLREFIPEIEAVNGLLGLTGQNAREASEHLAEMGNSTSASEAAYEKMKEAGENQLQLFQNNMNAFLAPLGDSLLKQVSDVASAMNKAFENGQIESSLETMETLVKLVAAAWTTYKVATLDATKTDNVAMAAKKAFTQVMAVYHKAIGDGIIQKEKERLTQEAYTASLENSLTAEQLAIVEKQNLKKGTTEYANALSKVATDTKKHADMEVESLSKSLAKNKERLSVAKERVTAAQEATVVAKKELDAALNANDIAAMEVAQTKVAIAAKREEAAVNEVNTISRKINNQEKHLGAARTQAETAATIINNATTAGNTAATNLNTRAHGFLAAAKLKAAIAARTLGAAIAANPIGAILTVISLAASAWLIFGNNTEKAKTKLQEFREEQDKLKESTDNLINTLYNANESDIKRQTALEQLKNILPEVYNGLTLENLALKNQNDLVKASNTALEENNEKRMQGLILASKERLETLKAEHGKVIGTSSSGMPVTIDNSRAIRNEEQQLSELERAYYKIQTAKQKLLEDSWPDDVKLSVYESELKNVQEQIEVIKDRITEATEAKENFSFTDWGNGPTFFDYSELNALEEQAKQIQNKIAGVNEKKQGSTVSVSGKKSLTDAEKKEAEKRKQALEEIESTVVDLELKLQQERLGIMADGRLKALAEIETDKKARLKALDNEEAELRKKYKSVGKSMPISVAENFQQRRDTVNEEASSKVTTTNKEYDRQEMQFQKELSSVFLTEEEKRTQAIKDRYDEMRRQQDEALQGELRNIQQTMQGEEAWNATVNAISKYADIADKINNAQTFEENKDKKEQYDALIAQLDDYKSQEYTLTREWDEKIAQASGNEELVEKLIQGKEKALNELNAQMLMQSDEWVKLFGDLDQLTISEFENLIAILKSKAKDLNLDSINLDKVLEKLKDAENEIKSRNPFRSLINHIKEYQKETDKAKKKASLKEIFGDTSEVLGMVNECFDSVIGGLKDMGLAGDEETQKLLGSISNMVGSAGELAGGIASMNPAAMISGAVGLITSAFDVFDRRSRKANQEIKQHQENVKNLEKQYRQLERETAKAIGSEKYSKQIDQVDNLKQKIIETEGMIAAEQIKSSKKRDDGKIADWESQIEDYRDKIEELKQGIVDELSTTDLYSFSNDMASSIIDGLCNGLDNGKEAIQEKINDLMKNVIAKQFDVLVIQNEMEDMFQAMADAVDPLKAGGVEITNWEMDQIVAAGQKGKDEIMNSLGRYKAILERLGLINDDVEDEIENGVTGELKAEMTEGTASELVGLWNMTALDIRSLLTLSNEHFIECRAHLANIANIYAQIIEINSNTKATATNTGTLIDKLTEGIKSLENKLEDIKKNTKGYNGRG